MADQKTTPAPTPAQPEWLTILLAALPIVQEVLTAILNQQTKQTAALEEQNKHLAIHTDKLKDMAWDLRRYVNQRL